MKKFIAAVASVLLFSGIVLAIPSSASAGSWKWCRPKTNHNNNHHPSNTTTNEDNDTVNVSVSNSASVDTTTVAVSNSGFVKQSKNDDDNTVVTGKAESHAKSKVTVNSVVIGVNVD